MESLGFGRGISLKQKVMKAKEFLLDQLKDFDQSEYVESDIKGLADFMEAYHNSQTNESTELLQGLIDPLTELVYDGVAKQIGNELAYKIEQFVNDRACTKEN